MSFTQYVLLALIPLLTPSIVWLVKLLLVERYTFIWDQNLTGKYVMLRLDRLSGKVAGFDWAGWESIKPHSGLQKTERPK
jgi:hypothetical protein